jgi:predicted DNA-binding transcriptional regulator AlpA
MKLIDMPTLREIIPRSETWFWREEKAGRFPLRIQLSENAVAWDEQAVLDWIAARPRGPARKPLLGAASRRARKRASLLAAKAKTREAAANGEPIIAADAE